MYARRKRLKFYSLRECSFTAERLNKIYACVCACALVLAQAHTHIHKRARVVAYIHLNTNTDPSILLKQ